MATKTREDEEIWELTVPSRVSLMTSDGRGGERHLSRKGIGQRLRMTTDDRVRAEEIIREDRNNPFRNGTLVRVDTLAGHDPSSDELSEADLKAVFDLDITDFEAMIPELSEINVRRLVGLIDTVDARTAQSRFLKEYVQKTYAIGGTVPSWDEMQVKPI